MATSVAMGVGVGVLAGIYPAAKAARMDPIVALRQE
jgi:putative ABC transport system permease protein